MDAIEKLAAIVLVKAASAAMHAEMSRAHAEVVALLRARDRAVADAVYRETVAAAVVGPVSYTTASADGVTCEPRADVDLDAIIAAVPAPEEEA